MSNVDKTFMSKLQDRSVGVRMVQEVAKHLLEYGKGEDVTKEDILLQLSNTCAIYGDLVNANVEAGIDQGKRVPGTLQASEKQTTTDS